MNDVTELPLNDEQINVLTILRVPLFHNYETGQRFIARRYWKSINTPLREALTRVLQSNG